MTREVIAFVGVVGVAIVLSLWWRPALSMPDAVRIPIVSPHPNGTPPNAALFRHGRHDQFDCSTCHPSLFPMWKAGFTHQEMDAGRFCGACHDGTAAAGINELDCESCHVPK